MLLGAVRQGDSALEHAVRDLEHAAVIEGTLGGVEIGVGAGSGNHDRTIAIAFAIAAGLALVLGMAVVPGWLALPLMALIGFCSGVAGPSRDLLVKRSTPAHASGRVYGVVYAGLDIGQAVIHDGLAFGILIDLPESLVVSGVAGQLRQVFVNNLGAPLEATTAVTPVPSGTEVLVRISHCGERSEATIRYRGCIASHANTKTKSFKD